MPKIEIESREKSNGDMYVKSGSTVTLRCVIKQSLEVPSFVFWYHEGNRVPHYDTDDKVQILSKRIDGTTDSISNLKIPNTRKQDSGNYTCSPNNLHSASVMLHVLNGNKNFIMKIYSIQGDSDPHLRKAEEQLKKLIIKL